MKPEDHPVVFLRGDILAAFATLNLVGLNIKACERQYEQMYSDAMRGPGEWDMHYKLKPPVSINEHLTKAPVLSPALAEGRAYRLTPGQRAVMRDWYGLTPTRQIEVVRMERFTDPAGTALPYLRTVTLASQVHVEEQNRKHVLSQIVITDWGKFMLAAAERDSLMWEAAVGKQKTDKAPKTAPKTPKSKAELEGEYDL